MNIKKVVVIFFVTVLLSAVAIDFKCGGNATCIVLQKCEGLYNQFRQDRSESLIKLVMKLHCGFEDSLPKICCPPELKVVNPVNLLPNLKVCGIQNNDRIVGGTRTQLDEHPWMALLQYDKPKGSGDCSPEPFNVPIEEIIAHEDFDPTVYQQQNDIALLRLAQEVTFNDFVKPICLPYTEELRSNSFEDYMLEVNIYNRTGQTITEKQLCAGGSEGQDSCRGDSGGPLMGQVSSMENWMVIGIVSYGPTPCGLYGWPVVYTRVTAFVDWILANIRP
ncbi:unnamed protein product [Euphydryas editha]|uniref:CLIP domain-containing serine protease n=1 Tax=Euphydryas editha TaxID=104508 RepID=A0AAU9TJA6_EUPED|nr:unnamed protein product [Euphydryas editha]